MMEVHTQDEEQILSLKESNQRKMNELQLPTSFRDLIMEAIIFTLQIKCPSDDDGASFAHRPRRRNSCERERKAGTLFVPKQSDRYFLNTRRNNRQKDLTLFD